MMNLPQQSVKKLVSTGKLLSDILHKACKIGQYLLLIIFYTLLTVLSYIYMSTLFRLEKEFFWCLLWFISGIWIQFNMVFNYTMCVIVKPGNPLDISYDQISYIKEKCKTCKVIKPPRAHHCSMCGQCVLQMDHHCPWIGQCVGHHNRAYFMNFLTYTFCGIIFLQRIMNSYMSKSIYKDDIKSDEASPMFFFEIYVFTATLIVVLGLFVFFHWCLVIKGKTTVQYCFNDSRYTPQKNWKHNLTLVFGTSNVLLIFLPKLSVLKIKGYNWKISNENYNTSMIEVEHTNLEPTVSQEKKEVELITKNQDFN